MTNLFLGDGSGLTDVVVIVLIFLLAAVWFVAENNMRKGVGVFGKLRPYVPSATRNTGEVMWVTKKVTRLYYGISILIALVIKGALFFNLEISVQYVTALIVIQATMLVYLHQMYRSLFKHSRALTSNFTLRFVATVWLIAVFLVGIDSAIQVPFITGSIFFLVLGGLYEPWFSVFTIGLIVCTGILGEYVIRRINKEIDK